MPLFRCLNEDCRDDPYSALPHHDFEDADKAGTCPKCGSSHAETPNVVCVRVAVHYLVNQKDGKIATKMGRRSIACQPAIARLTGSHQCTGVHLAVTCPKCMATPVFQQHQADDVDQSVADSSTLANKGKTV